MDDDRILTGQMLAFDRVSDFQVYSILDLSANTFIQSI